MNPSPDAIAKIQAAVNATAAKWTPDNPTVLANITAVTVPNPKPAAQVPAPLTWARLKAALTDAEIAAVFGHGAFHDVRADVRAGDRAGVLECLDGFRAAGILGAAKVTALTNAINGTVADPSYRANVSQLEIDLGRLPDLDDIAAARPKS
jgi:hypothetical protein